MVFSPAALGQTEGRAPPGCSESNISDISNSLSLDAGLCWKMNLGTLQPGDVFEIEINIINDAIDNKKYKNIKSLDHLNFKISLQKNFYKKAKLFKKIMVSCPLLHENIKDISIKDIKYYLDYKVEFDLIFLN